jgi:cytoskeletal protein CcmA (bactofilin family)
MAETVEVRGKVEGKISCVTLTLRAAAQVTADSNYTTLAIESGATVEGRFTRTTS